MQNQNTTHENILDEYLLKEWLENNNIPYRITGYSVYPVRSKYFFRLDINLRVMAYALKTDLIGNECPDREALIQTQALLWDLEYIGPYGS